MIPRKRHGSYFPSFLEPRRRSEQAIVAVVMEAYVNGVCTRKVDRLVEQLGVEGMTKDRVSAMCRALDEQVELFRQRPLEGAYPYLWLDAKHVKVRDHGRVVSKALVVAYAVHETGLREVIGLDIGEVESGGFWVEFLRGCAKADWLACAWRSPITTKDSSPRSPGWWPARCSAARCTSSEKCSSTAAATNAAWSPPPSRGVQRREPSPGARADRARDRPARAHRPEGVPAARGRRGGPDRLLLLPPEHWTKLRSTNPLERVNKEIGRRSDVVGIFPDDASVIRLAGALLSEQNDEWLVHRRYLSVESMTLILDAGQSEQNSLEQQDKEAIALNAA